MIKIMARSNELSRIASLGLLVHAIGALYTLTIFQQSVKGTTWTSNFIDVRNFLNLTEIEHEEYTIIFLWMRSIQTRYVLTDSFAFYHSFRHNNNTYLHLPLMQVSERSERALREDEHTRDESKPTKWLQTATSPTELTHSNSFGGLGLLGSLAFH